jgi:hypothetical protein
MDAAAKLEKSTQGKADYNCRRWLKTAMQYLMPCRQLTHGTVEVVAPPVGMANIAAVTAPQWLATVNAG